MKSIYGIDIMKLSQLAIVSVSMLLTLTTCSNDQQDTYTIARKGVLLQSENFDVIHVYGFSDNREVARQISTFLNESEPETYDYYKTK